MNECVTVFLAWGSNLLKSCYRSANQQEVTASTNPTETTSCHFNTQMFEVPTKRYWI